MRETFEVVSENGGYYVKCLLCEGSSGLMDFRRNALYGGYYHAATVHGKSFKDVVTGGDQ